MSNKTQKSTSESISGQISVLIRGFPPNTDLEEIRQYLDSICQDGTFKMSKKKCQFHGYAFLYFKEFEVASEFSKKKFYFKNTLLECKFPVDRDRYIKQCINDLKYPRKVFVDKIPKSYRNNEIKCVFSGFGKVQSVILIESNDKPINQAMVTFEEYNAAYKSVMKHIINTRDGACITVFYAQPKFSEYMLLSVDSRLRSYIREVQKRKRPFNPEEIRLLWDGKLIDVTNNKKTGARLLKGQNQNLNVQSSREEQIDSNNYNENLYNANDFDQFPGLNGQFDVELDQILNREIQTNLQNFKPSNQKNSDSSKNTLLSQKNRRQSSNSTKNGSQNNVQNNNVNQNFQGENLMASYPKLDSNNQNDSANNKFETSKSSETYAKSVYNLSNNRSQSDPSMAETHNLYEISSDLYHDHSVENKLIGGNHQTNIGYNQEIVPTKLTMDSNSSNYSQKLERVHQNLPKTQKNCKKQNYKNAQKQQKMNKQAYEREANGNHYDFSWENNQQNMQQSQYTNGDQQSRLPYQNDYNQNGAYQTMYDQSYMSSNDTRQNNQDYGGQQNNQYAENTYAQSNQYEQNQACWDGTYYNTQQEHYHYYQETHTNYESSYDYQQHHAKTAYNDHYQNENLNYECPNTQTNGQENMYDWKNYSNDLNTDADYKQSNLRNEGFYYNEDPYHQNHKDFVYQSPANEQYYSLEQQYDCAH